MSQPNIIIIENKNLSDTEKSVDEFLNEQGIDFSIFRLCERKDENWQYDMWQYSFVKRHKKETFTGEFKTGLGHRIDLKKSSLDFRIRIKKPSAASVLHCLILDSEAMERSFLTGAMTLAMIVIAFQHLIHINNVAILQSK